MPHDYSYWMTSEGNSDPSSASGLKLDITEKKLMEQGPCPPFRITAHWLSLLDGTRDDPLRRQVVPSSAEWVSVPGDRNDPLGEDVHSPLPRLIRRYNDRALVVLTGTCALYCRHCFRRRLNGDDFGEISDKESSAIAGWLFENTEVKELLLSGGDPLTMKDRRLLRIIDTFREARPDIVLRLATRMPIVDPGKVSPGLIRALGKRRPLWIVIQVNHPRELSPDSRVCIDRLQKQGLPVINQAVLLKGINDSVEVLEELSQSLVRLSVKPYYLFQGDLAEGTAQFRLPLAEARELVEQLRNRVSGLAMPVFAVDLPGGGGKVPLGTDYVEELTGKGWKLKTPDGAEGYYPDPVTTKESV